AMACGAPVITGSAAALGEIGGDAVDHLEQVDVEALGDRLVALATSRERREELSSRGLLRARMFSWRRAARESLEIYRRTAARHALIAPGAPEEATARPIEVLAPASPATALGAASWRAIDVLFGQGYFLRFDPKLWAARQPYAPL